MLGFWAFIIFESLIMHLLLPENALAMSDSVYVGVVCLNIVVLVFALLRRYSHDRRFAMLIIGGLALRLLFMFWSMYCSHIFTLPNSGADEWTYYYNAMSNLVKDKAFVGYAQFFAWQAKIFGLSMLYGKFINVLLSISAIIILRKTLMILDVGYTVRNRVIAFACFLPNFAILSSLLLRESAIVLLISVSTYYFVLWWKESGTKRLILSVAAAIIASWLHSGLIAYMLGIICIAATSVKTVSGRKYTLTSLKTLVLTAIISVIIFVILLNTNIGLVNYFRGADSLADIVSISDVYEDGGSAYNANVVSNETTLGFIINTPFRMLYFIFAPMPWDWRSATDAIAFVFSGLFYGYVLLKAVPYVLKGRRYPFISAMFLVSILMLMVFGWGVSNSGTALRHRDKMVIHYLVMLALMNDDKLSKTQHQTGENQ